MPESIDGTDLEIARECGARERKFWDADEVSMVVFTPDQLTAFADRIRAQQREHDAAVVAEAAYDAAIRYANGMMAVFCPHGRQCAFVEDDEHWQVIEEFTRDLGIPASTTHQPKEDGLGD